MKLRLLQTFASSGLLRLAFTATLVFVTVVAEAQYSGPTGPMAGYAQTYSFYTGVDYGNDTWSASGGTVQSTWVNYGAGGPTYFASVYWDTSGAGSVTFDSHGVPYGVNVGPCVMIYTVSGGGSYCAGGSGVTISLSGSEVGINYKLGASGSLVSGTGGALTWTNVTAAGTYQVTAYRTDISCNAVMNGSATVTVIALPTGYTVSGGGTICTGQTASMSMFSSEVGVTYQVKRDGTNVGSPVSGTGSQLVFGPYGQSGTYTVVASRSGCNQTMPGQAVYVVNNYPTVYTLTRSGTGTHCSTDNNEMLSLSGSQVGYSYQLIRDGNTIGSAVAGTGASLKWYSAGMVTGTYSVGAFIGNCSSNMTGSHVVTINVTPPVGSVGGTATICSNASAQVTLSTSATGVYTLYRNGVSQATQNGTGAALSFTVTQAGTYTITATNNGCTANMTGNAVITVNQAPATYTVSGGGTVCSPPGTGVPINLSSSESSASYQLKLNGTNVGSPVAGTGSSLVWASQTTSGTYTVTATNSNCSTSMSGSAVISNITGVSGGSISPTTTYLYGPSPGSLTLSSFGGNVVKWQYKTGSTFVDISNTASNYAYDGITTRTTFRAVVSNGTCTNNSAEAVVEYFNTPVITGTNQIPFSGGNTTLTVQTGYYSYQWYQDGIAIAGATSNTYNAFSVGTYTVGVKGVATAPEFESAPFRVTTPGSLHKVTDIRIAGQTTMPNLGSLTTSQYAQTIEYTDGLARPIQSIANAASPLQKDLISAVAYDAAGRSALSYLPYVSTTAGGAFRPSALTSSSGYTQSEQYRFYQNYYGNAVAIDTTKNPYGQSVFEPSPLGRITEQASPGFAWKVGLNHTTRASFLVNSQDVGAAAAIKDVRIWTTGGPTGSYYANGLLTVSKMIDENSNEVYVFANKLGQTVLKRVQLGETVEGVLTNYLETYFVYDGLGRLALQIPPKAVTKLNSGTTWTTAFRDEWCFTYTYDERSRMVESKRPGISPVYYVYDIYNRPVLSQDGLQRAQNKWIFIKYDFQNRPIVSGIYTNTTATTRPAVQTFVNGIYVSNATYPAGTHFESRGVTWGYSNVSFPKVNDGVGTALEYLSVNYYDNYDFDFNGSEDYTYTTAGLPNEGTQASAFGLPTGVRKFNLSMAASTVRYIFYDQFARVIQTRSSSHLAPASNVVTNTFDFEGKVIQTKIQQVNTNNNSSAGITLRREYDHMGRLTKIFEKALPQPTTEQLVAQYEYNELGQLIDKKLHNTTGTTFLQSIDYRYNIRGWLKSINNATLTNDGQLNNDTDDYFGMELAYETVDAGLGNTPYYNGNISATKWKGIGAATGNPERRAYKFTYDKADRLKQAQFRMYGTSAWNQEVNTLNERMLYDNNGNILNLARRRNQRSVTGFTVNSSAQVMDSLAYTYATGNQLSKVEDDGISAGFTNGSLNGSSEYTYDANGNLTADKNKGISLIEYYLIGKPSRIVYTDGRVQLLTYDGTGGKLVSRTYANNGVIKSRIDYVDGFQYESKELVYQPSPEGRIARKGDSMLAPGTRDCSSASGITGTNATATVIAQNGETYVKASATTSGTNSAGLIVYQGAAQASKRYSIRVKGYVQTGASFAPSLQITSNAGTILASGSGPALAVGPANEEWASYEFSTLAGTTSITCSVQWAATANIPAGQEFYLNEIELRPVVDEYQYSIADNQGNTRVVFSSVTGTPKVSTANMEASTNAEFPNYSSIFRSSVNLFDHTDAGTTYTYSNLLNGGNNQQVGLAKSYQVMPGDKVKIEAYAKYSNPTSTTGNLAGFATALLGAFGASAPVAGEVNTIRTGLNGYGSLVAAGNGPNSTGPKAFVNILIFDKNYNLIDVAFEAIDPAAQQVGVSPVVAHDYMMREYTVKEAGYAFMYVSNENPTQVDVYFDDVVMTYTPGNVIQYNEYYPYGMRTGNSWDRVDDQPTSSLQTGLVVRIPFDGDGKDLSGNNNHATFFNGMATTKLQGRPEAALLDGTDDYAQIADAASLDFGANDFSIAIWVKKLAPTSAHDNREVIHKWDNSLPTTQNEWLLATTSDGTDSKVRFHVSQGSTYTTITTTDELVIGNWYHLAVIRAGTMLKLYVNGVLKASANIGTAAINNVGRNVTLGKALSGMYTNAAYDDLYIYGRALTEEELRTLYLDKPELMVNNYLYNSASEYDNTSAWYDTFFRSYDAALGRFGQVDPKADKFGAWSPYQYGYNSPIRFNDPLGDQSTEGYSEQAMKRIAQLIDAGFAVSFSGNYSDWAIYSSGAQLLANERYQKQLADEVRRGSIQAIIQYSMLFGETYVPTTISTRRYFPDGVVSAPYNIRFGGYEKVLKTGSESETQQTQGDTWDAINSKFGPSFRKDYLPQLLEADGDASDRQSVIKKIMKLSEVNLTDNEGNTMRPVQYQITYGLKSNWSDSNKYGLVDGTTITGNILSPAYWSNDPIWGNPGRLTSTGSANPVGLGFNLPNGDTGFWYVTVYFQKSYPN